MKKILSYLFEIQIEKTSSSLNPVLEVVLQNGKYALHSQNTNYSHGTLHTLFKRIFRIFSLDWTQINEVLILGFGAGSIAEIIASYKPKCAITGVEIDSKVIELGKKYFGNEQLKNNEIICSSADVFVKNTDKKFDLIIIDAFIDMKVPDELETLEFLKNINKNLNKNGGVIFNKVIYTDEFENQIPELYKLYENVFDSVKLITVMETGKIFFARKL